MQISIRRKQDLMQMYQNDTGKVVARAMRKKVKRELNNLFQNFKGVFIFLK